MNTPKTNGHKAMSNGHHTPLDAVARDFFAVLFRRRWQILVSFAGIFVVVAVISLLWADRYRASMMILVSQNERADAPVNGQPDAQPIVDHNGVTVEEINSEVALLESRDLLQQVVADCGLDKGPQPFWRLLLHGSQSAQQRTAEAVQALAEKLKVEILPMSDMIQVSYASSNPELAAHVLKTLAGLYMQKHVAVHRSPEVFAFFQQQAQHYRSILADDESKLVDYTKNEGVVSAPEQMTAALDRLSQFQSMQDETQAEAIGTEHRIQELEKVLKTMDPRVTTAVKTSDNAQLLQNLKSTLLSLELKRTQLLANYQPTYRPVREVEKQIAETQAAIANAENAPWREVTTDRDPTFMSALADLTRARATLADEHARAAALAQMVGGMRSRAVWLQQQGVVQQNMMRDFKTAEANYLLYLDKTEQARISDALDSRRILNVALAESPSVPSLPVHSPFWCLALSGFVAGLAAIGLAFVTDNLDPTVRTPDDVEMLLSLPVLAVLPRTKNGKGTNGNGNGNGHHHHVPGNGNGNGRHETHVS